MEKVAILLSVYHPDEVYLEKQLRSLNEQTYPNLELLIWNDLPGEPVNRGLVEKCITSFPVRYCDNGRNNGYCKAFENLVSICDAEYLAFCDQDDIWLPDKLSECVAAIKKEGALAAVCDRAIIDKNDRITCESNHHHSRRKYDNWETGEDITTQEAFMCYGPGLCIVAQTSAAKSCIPFCSETGHDKWLLLCFSAMGKIAFVDKPLVQYRRYGKNVSGILRGVRTKKEYYEKRVFGESEAIVNAFSEKFPEDSHIPDMIETQKARKAKKLLPILRNRKSIPDLYLYEAGLIFCPAFIFDYIVRWIKHE